MIIVSASPRDKGGESIARLKSGLMAFSVTGTIARKLTFYRLPRLLIVKRKPTPTGTPSSAQLAQRLKYANCLQSWQELDPDEKQDYIDQAKGYPQTALSLFLHACLLAGPTTATLHGTMTLGTQVETYAVIRFFTPGTQIQVMKLGTPVYHDGTFTLTGITPGTYDIGIKCAAALSNLVLNKTFVAGETTEVDFGIVRRGELNMDDWVTAQDRAIMYLWWGLSGACSAYPGNWLLP